MELFNSPFELGIRMVYLLSSLRPRQVDLQTLVYLDYATIYSEDFDGPLSLHTPVPFRGGEYTTRREVIEEGLYLMATKDLVTVKATDAGINYGIGESGLSMTQLISGVYASQLLERCVWVSENFGNFSMLELENQFGLKGVLWGSQFITSQNSKGL